MATGNGSEGKDLLLQVSDQVGNLNDRLGRLDDRVGRLEDRLDQGLAQTNALIYRTMELLKTMENGFNDQLAESQRRTMEILKRFDDRLVDTDLTLTKVAETLARYTEILSSRVTDHEFRITKLETRK